MVRFIIWKNQELAQKIQKIYIPLWLDLLFAILTIRFIKKMNLHSTMVRFIILKIIKIEKERLAIYIPLWLDLLQKKYYILEKHTTNLHSTMVRFIILSETLDADSLRKFTFHYGQIYYAIQFERFYYKIAIYIPIWLDLLWLKASATPQVPEDLHSTMVRFIIRWRKSYRYSHHLFTFHYGQIYYFDFRLLYGKRELIYIPLWLDLLSTCAHDDKRVAVNLHSTMVRFIMKLIIKIKEN